MEIELPPKVFALFEQASMAQMRNQFAKANRLYREMAALAVKQGGDLHSVGTLLRTLGRAEEARLLLQTVHAKQPGWVENNYELGLAKLTLGDYPGGWPLYENRRDIPAFKIITPALPFPEWKGEPLAGKRIVLFPEQGLGDNIQFARFALTLRDQGAQVVMLCRPVLTRLLSGSLDGVEVQGAEGTVEMGEPDYWAHFGSLPGPLGLTPDTLPNAPYLRAPNPRPKTGGVRIGLVTKGNAAHQNDSHRSLTEEDAARLRALLPGQIVSLHPEDTGAKDFADTADIVAGLDLVVTVDTSVAHLAGAMGVPTFVLLPGFATDWRWLRDREDTPWYPSVKLFRSHVNGDWSEAIDGLGAAVREHLGASPATPSEPVFQDALRAQTAGAFDEAMALYRQAIDLAPGEIAPRHNLAALLLGVGRPAEAQALLTGLAEQAPDQAEITHALALALLAGGDYARGWPLYEARRRLPALSIPAPSPPFPEWKGEPLEGKRIMLFPEQGLGDNIQFARFALTLRDRGAEVLWLARPPLTRLFQPSLDGVEVQTAAGQIEIGEPDYWALYGSLPARLGITLETLPSEPYLRAAPGTPGPKPGHPRIGLVTRGNPTQQNDARRSLPPAEADRLRAGLPGEVVSLQLEDITAKDFADTAAIIEGLDLVVSVDTAVAHLAGAMGKPALLLIPGFTSDWRWMAGRADSPWYPKARLFRSTVDGDWSEAIAGVQTAAADLIR